MNKYDLEYIKSVLERIKSPDARVSMAIIMIDKKLTYYKTLKGQLKDMYDYDRESS